MKQTEFYQAKLAYEIDSWDLSATVDHSGEVVVVDARSSEAFELEHIPGAINIPHRTINAESTRGLDQAKTYIIYCDGIGCNASTKGALNLTRLGFRVKELLGGLDWWKRDGHPTEGRRATKSKAKSCGC